MRKSGIQEGMVVGFGHAHHCRRLRQRQRERIDSRHRQVAGELAPFREDYEHHNTGENKGDST